MPTCMLCGGFYDEYHPCIKCTLDHEADVKAGHIPPGLSPGAFTYAVWRRVKGLEREVGANPELYTEEEIQFQLQKILEGEEEHYQRAQQAAIHYSEQQKRYKRPPVKLY